jgi:hypothetical protein
MGGLRHELAFCCQRYCSRRSGGLSGVARIEVPNNIDTIVQELQRIGYWNGWAATASCVAAAFICLSLIGAR